MDKDSTLKIYGVLGYPAKHSLSPPMHNAAFQALKINAEYTIFEKGPEELTDFLSLNCLKEKNIWGLNVTIPYKIKAKEILERIFPFDEDVFMMDENLYYVKLSGAINTIKRDADKLEYRNTDAAGFLESLNKDLKFETKNKKVLIIGCGGAGRAIIAALSWINSGIDILYVNDISKEAMESANKHFAQFPHLEKKLKFISKEEIPGVIKNCHLLVNASAVGMKGEDISVIDKNLLRKDLYVYDVVYNKNRETRLIKDAKSIGPRYADGLNMLLYQGARSFEFWTEQKAPIGIMRKALINTVKKYD